MYGEWHESIRTRQPAPGAAVVFSVPGETYMRIDMVRVTLVASAAVANRYVAVDYLDGDLTIAGRIASPNALTAGLTRGFTAAFGAGASALSAGGEELLPLADVMLPPGFKLRITAIGLDVGDQFSAATLHTRRYPSTAWEMSQGARPYEPA